MRLPRRSNLLFTLCLLLAWVVPVRALELRGFPSDPFFSSAIFPGRAAPALSVSGQGRFYFDSVANVFKVSQNAGAYVTMIPAAGAAPLDAKYITQALHADLSAEQSLGALTTGLTLNTVTAGTGVLSAYAGASCTNQFPRSLDASGAATCASVSLTADTTGTLGVGSGGTGLTVGTSGGVLGYTATGTLASSVALTANALVIGGGAGAMPTALGSLGTTTTVLHGNAAGNPSFGAVSLTADVSGILPGANGGTGHGFFAVTGPTTSLKTFTFPDASSTVAVTSNTLSVFASTTSAQLAGVLSDETGTGLAVFGTAPTFITSITNPLVIGGTGTTSTLSLRSTSGIGAAGADIIFQVGNNGATEAMRILNSGNIGFGTATPKHTIQVSSRGTIWVENGDRLNITQNLYNEASVWKYLQTAAGSFFQFTPSGGLQFYTAPSGTADAAATITNRLDVTVVGNVGIGTIAYGTNAAVVVSLGSATAPTTSPADVVQMWATDVAGAGTFGLNIRDEGGNTFRIGNGQYLAPNGTASLPAFSFVNAPAVGFFWTGSGNIARFADSGTGLIEFSGSQLRVTSGHSIGWDAAVNILSGRDTALFRDAAGIIAQRNGINAQTFRGYGTFTDASNYERWALSATIGTGITLAAETAGTGADNLSVTLTPAGTGNVLAAIGASGLFQVGSTLRFAVTDGATGTGTRLRTAQATAPTCTTNCGTTPSVSGSDSSMIVTLGTGSPASPITVTFNGTWATNPPCHGTNRTTAANYITRVDSTTTTAVVYFAAGPAASDLIGITCMGNS